MLSLNSTAHFCALKRKRNMKKKDETYHFMFYAALKTSMHKIQLAQVTIFANILHLLKSGGFLVFFLS